MLNLAVVLLMLLGLFFFFGTAAGIVRFPDFYTRMHAAGKGDTLSSMLLLAGLALYHLHGLDRDALLVSLKLGSIILFIFVASPTATHAIMDAGFEAKIKHWVKRRQAGEPWTGPERRQKEEHP
jgi:multicomponent Na+:H+ antiporter subunit G